MSGTAKHSTATFVEITKQELVLADINKLISDPRAGGISAFCGVTRNHHNGKKVLKLEYEAYDEMAKKEMVKIAKQIREKWSVIGVAIYHRVGQVDIGQSSVRVH